MQKQLKRKVEKLEEKVLDVIARHTAHGNKFWYWSGADQFEPADYEKEQQKYGETLYNMAIEDLEDKGLVTTIRVKGASNAEYYKATKKGLSMVK